MRAAVRRQVVAAAIRTGHRHLSSVRCTHGQHGRSSRGDRSRSRGDGHRRRGRRRITGKSGRFGPTASGRREEERKQQHRRKGRRNPVETPADTRLHNGTCSLGNRVEKQQGPKQKNSSKRLRSLLERLAARQPCSNGTYRPVNQSAKGKRRLVLITGNPNTFGSSTNLWFEAFLPYPQAVPMSALRAVYGETRYCLPVPLLVMAFILEGDISRQEGDGQQYRQDGMSAALVMEVEFLFAGDWDAALGRWSKKPLLHCGDD